MNGPQPGWGPERPVHRPVSGAIPTEAPVRDPHRVPPDLRLRDGLRSGMGANRTTGDPSPFDRVPAPG